ncbi:MAG: carboxypeptidase-like regulatory domain-containing protein, partial [Prolixibacteraceae bacterium]|nr:carboxypeptidase-like regulatory domain-containing protein [Prolixibacteraceae bacterium]
MKRFILFFFIVISSPVWAQQPVIKGKIVDSATQKGIPYTNIGIEGTFFGTASDSTGVFELKIPEGNEGRNLLVSAVGYGNASYIIKDILNKKYILIPLIEQTYKIKAVDVSATSKVLFRIVKNVIEKIPENFVSGPLRMEWYYQESEKIDSTENRLDAVVLYSDKTGYSKPSILGAFKDRNYYYEQVRKNYKIYSFPSGQTGFDGLLDMDLARTYSSVFNEKTLDDFDLHLDNTMLYNGDYVWVISYKLLKPDLVHSGDFFVKKLEGKMYVEKNNFALIRNECEIYSDWNNAQNRSLGTHLVSKKDVRYHFISLYSELFGLKYLGSLSCDESYTTRDGKRVSFFRSAKAIRIWRSSDLI